MSSEYKFKKEMSEMNEYTPRETVAEINEFPFMAMPERKLTKETCERFGVRAAVNVKDGSTVEAYYFPSYNQKGKIVGYTKQDITKGKEEKGHWTAIGSVAIGNKMFGQDVAEKIDRKRSNLIITEGQIDAMSAFQALVDNVKGTKYEGLEPMVVSIPLGTKNAVESVMHNREFIESHDALTIFFDADECTPAEAKKGIMKGAEARHAVAGALMGNGQSLFVVTPPVEFKDASDMLQANQSSELAKLIQFGRRPYSPEKVVSASQITFEELISPREAGVYVDCFPELMKKLNGFRRNELTMLLAPSNVGKCHGKGQGILMYDLSVKNVEDIVVGDEVMGPDGTKRTVLGTHSGFDTIYKVVPNKGEPYTVNSEHILYLQPNATVPKQGMVKDEAYLISTKDFLALPKYYKEHVVSGVFADVEKFGEGYYEDAYILGLWLAEGSRNDSSFCLCRKDEELHAELKRFAEAKGYELKVYPSNDRKGSVSYRVNGGFRALLKEWGVFSEKFIPDFIFKANKKTRMELLAGFVDGDGHVSQGTVELTLKKDKLAQDIVKLARSCGIRVTVGDKFAKCQNFEGDIYTRIRFFGNVQNIPNRLPRKKIEKTPNRNPMRVGIRVEEVGYGEYYGFEVDGDNLYCLPDYQITHNTTVCSVLAHRFMKAGHKIGMIFLEEGNKETMQRIVAAELGVNYLKFMRDPLAMATRERIQEVYDDLTSNNRLFMLNHFGSIPVSDLLNKIKHMVLAEGCRYIILDHISAVISGLEMEDERKSLDVAMTHLAAFCAANDVHLLVVSHINRSDSQQFLPPKGKEGEAFWVNVRKESARGSAALEQFSWNILALEPEILPDFSRGRVRLKVLKTRFGDSLGIADVFTLDNDTWEVLLDNPDEVSF